MEINEKELRIGNWVIYQDEFDGRSYELEFTIGHFMGIFEKNYGPPEPIPLTEEWIIKMGFKKLNNSMFRRGALTLQWTTMHTGETLHEKILSSQKAIRICLGGSFVCNVAYVHKMQNFFYAISGNEIMD